MIAFNKSREEYFGIDHVNKVENKFLFYLILTLIDYKIQSTFCLLNIYEKIKLFYKRLF